MAHVRDLWTKPNPEQGSRKKRVRSARWGTGKRWQVVGEENGVRTTKSFQGFYIDSTRTISTRRGPSIYPGSSYLSFAGLLTSKLEFAVEVFQSAQRRT
ncbi:hypothetical protein [Corynebacterium cystitidis]|uniref:hypothetical protein n=1 Tax=Corynebacterium cystitidis TaxID=35757 RepID=UPI00211DC57B|nr:hypothetical protein [Corynebacterium cystitidis]